MSLNGLLGKMEVDLKLLGFYDNLNEFTPTEMQIDEYLEAFTFPLNSDESVLLIDQAIVKDTIMSLETQNKMGSLALLLELPKALTLDVNETPIYPLMRKLFACGFYCNQLIKTKHFDFLQDISVILNRVYQHLKTTPRHMHMISSIIAFTLDILSARFKDIIITLPENKLYAEILTCALDLYLIPNFLNESVILQFLNFFLWALMSFNPSKEVPQDCMELLSRLGRILISTISMPITLKFDYPMLVLHLITLLSRYSKAALSLSIRSILFNLIAALISKFDDIAFMVFDTANIKAIASYISDSLISIPFEAPKREGELLDIIQAPTKYIDIDHFLKSSFDENIEFAENNGSFMIEGPFELPPMPELMTTNDITLLMQSITRICTSVTFQPRTLTHIQIMGVVLKDETIQSLPILPYFLQAWIRQFVISNLDLAIDSLHNISFFKHMLKQAFIIHQDPCLIDFCINFFLFINTSKVTANVFMLDILKFYIKLIKSMILTEKFVHFVATLIFQTPSRFMDSCISGKFNFVERLAVSLMMFQKFSDENIEKERVQNTRKLVFYFISLISANPMLFQFFFDKPIFTRSICKHLYDPSTCDFAAKQLALVLQQFPASSECINMVIDFARQTITKPPMLPLHLYTLYIDICKEAFQINPIEIGIVFSKTNFLDALVTFAVNHSLSDCLPKLIDLIAQCTTKRSVNQSFVPAMDVFMKLRPLILEQLHQSLVDYLLKIVFNDDLLMTKPRPFANSLPLSLIFLLIKEDDKELYSFLQFVKDCFECDFNSKYELAETDFSSQLLSYLIEYRQKTQPDELFTFILNFFEEISMFSLRINDFLSLFHLFTTLPGHTRPFFTIPLLKVLTNLFNAKETSPAVFYNLKGKDTMLRLPLIPAELMSGDFAFSIRIEFLEEAHSNASLFEFIDNKNSLIGIYFEDETLVLKIIYEGTKVSVVKFKDEISINQWHLITFMFTSNSITFYLNGKLVSTQDIKKPIFNIHFSLNTIAKGLKCNIQQIMITKEVLTDKEIQLLSSLPSFPVSSFIESEAKLFPIKHGSLFKSEFHNKLHFLYNADVTSRQFSINLVGTDILEIKGLVYQMTPKPKFVLNNIGGVNTILPLFAQLEQPIEGSEYVCDPNFLPLLLKLLKTVFLNQYYQEDFIAIDGFSILSFLLSLAGIEHFTNEITELLCQIYDSLYFPSIQIQMINNIFFDLRLWIYLPINTQITMFRTFFSHIHKSNLKNLRVSLNVTRILYLIRTFLWNTYINSNICLNKEPKQSLRDHSIINERPEDLSPIRSLFWELAKVISKVIFSPKDIHTAITFCFDETDSVIRIEAIQFLISLLKDKNHYVIEALQTKYSFSHFFALLETTDLKVVDCFFRLFVYARSASEKILKQYTMNEWIFGMIRQINETNLNEKFLKSFIPFIIRASAGCDNVKQKLDTNSKLKYPEFIPILLLGFCQDNKIKIKSSYNAIDILIRKQPASVLSPDSIIIYSLILFYIHLKPTLQSESNEVANKVLLLIVNQLINEMVEIQNTNPLAEITSIISLISIKTHVNYSHVLKMIFMTLINSDEFRQSKIHVETLCNIYQVVFRFIFQIPSYDHQYFSIPIEEKPYDQKIMTFKEVFNSVISEEAIEFELACATRTTYNKEWMDSDLASWMLCSILSTPVLFSQATAKIRRYHPVEMCAHIVATGIQHPIHTKNYINNIQQIIDVIPKTNPLKGPFKRAMFIIMGGLQRAVDHQNVEKRLIIKLEEYQTHFSQILAKRKISKNDEGLHSIVEKYSRFENKLIAQTQKDEAQMLERIKIYNDSFGKSAKKDDTKGKLRSASGNYRIMNEQEKIISSLEHFSTNIRNHYKIANKRYRDLFRQLSTDNGPWQTPEVDQIVHFKLDSTYVFNGFTHAKLKFNLKFNNHKDASIAREVGNQEKSAAMYQEQMAKLRMKEFKGDFALVSTDEEIISKDNTHESSETELTIVTCDAFSIDLKSVKVGTVTITSSSIVFESEHKFIKIPLDKITKVYLRRYLLKETAIEIFTKYKKSYFFAFPDNRRKLVLSKINNLYKTKKMPSLKYIQQKAEDAIQLAQKATEQWVNGKLSNFKYLLKLNKYAGRTYNDLSQYPVFPWVLKDYRSEKIDLNDPNVFRDLSIPMGAQTKHRLEELLERYHDADADFKFMYGAFYSSAAVVIGYLVRLEPYTSLHIQLQSGRFDHPDRLFVSIPRAYDSCCASSMDFRELIPEFYYLPDFLENRDDFDLGKLRSGGDAGQLELPAWAKTPNEFININRQALESKIVSMNLDKWIDLIFGPKSRLPEAAEANNVFHPYFYETALTPEVINDPVQYGLVKEYAACFGTVPGKLFNTTPPYKNRSALFSNIFSFQKMPNTEYSVNGTIVVMNQSENLISAITDNYNFIILNFKEEQPSITRGHLDISLPEELADTAVTNQVLAISGTYALVAFPWDSLFMVFKLRQGENAQLYGSRIHTKRLTYAAMYQNIFVTGSEDCTVRIWKIKNNKVKQIGSLAKHISPIVAIAMNRKLNTIFSISRDGFCSAMSFKGKFLKAIQLPNSDPSMIVASDFGYVTIAFNGTNSCLLYVFDQNLLLIKSETLNGSFTAMQPLLWNGLEFLMYTTRNMRMLIVSLPYLETNNEVPINMMVKSIVGRKTTPPELYCGSASQIVPMVPFFNEG